MAVKKLTVYEALLEISRYNDKIDSFNSYTNIPLFLGHATEYAKSINGIKREEFISSVQSNYDSIRHLISNLTVLKSAVALSNSQTVVSLGGKDYTITELIQRKASINNDIILLNMIKQQITSTVKEVNNKNKKCEDGLASYLESVKGESSTPDDIQKLTDTYYSNNKYGLVDPNNLIDKVNIIEEDINKFLSEVDTVITTSNCSTIIEVEFED